MRDSDGVLWRQGTGKMPARQQEAVDLAKLKEAQERDRLLYVALTRAERWLVVGAAGDLGKTGDTWYDKVRLGMGRSGAVPQEYGFGDLGGGEGLRLSHLDWSTLPLRETPPAPPVTQVQPQDFDAPIPPAPAAFETLSPSGLGGAKALAGADGDSEDLAMARGTALHEMLEHLAHLPDDQRDGSMEHLIAHLSQNPETALAVPHMPQIASEALRVLRDPALGFIFAPDTLAEVPITADLPGLGRMHGVIDRLIVTADKVIAVDFKTNRTVPPAVNKVPEGLLRQMGAYLVALQQLYPDRQIETGLLWTVTSTYMPLADTDITKALARVSAT
jgi:ATP-dependent helicase/nuclease subunit A